jgi:hypothetical protein
MTRLLIDPGQRINGRELRIRDLADFQRTDRALMQAAQHAGFHLREIRGLSQLSQRHAPRTIRFFAPSVKLKKRLLDMIFGKSFRCGDLYEWSDCY